MSGDLRLDFVVPVLRLGTFDPIEQFVGARIADLVAPVLAGPISARRLPTGALVEVYPLRLPAGEGAGITLGAWGELAFANLDGHLVLTVPRLTGRWIASALGRAVVHVRELDGGLAEFTVAIRPGLRAAWQLGSLGEVGLETPTEH